MDAAYEYEQLSPFNTGNKSQTLASVYQTLRNRLYKFIHDIRSSEVENVINYILQNTTTFRTTLLFYSKAKAV